MFISIPSIFLEDSLREVDGICVNGLELSGMHVTFA